MFFDSCCSASFTFENDLTPCVDIQCTTTNTQLVSSLVVFFAIMTGIA